jgi:signal transduction histidine kinase
MAKFFAAQRAPVAQRIEEVSGIRPVTLLIASGIVLITAILIATGTAANHLRQQEIATTEGELGRIDSILAEASKRSLSAVDAQLADVAESVQLVGGDLRETAATPQIAALLRSKIGRSSNLDAAAIITADGTVLDRAGAWPATDNAWRELFATVPAPPGRAIGIGAPLRDAPTGTVDIPLVHRIQGPQGTPVGAVVGLMPAADLAHLFAAVPLPDDAAIALLRSDGTMLARYPALRGAPDRIAQDGELGALFNDTRVTMVRHVSANDGGWRIEALRALSDYPVAVAVSRSADRVLAGWSRQGMWFAIVTLIGTVAIGFMVYLIAHQFQTHDALATIRAEKIESERARLAAEAELLKAERLSVLGQLTATVAHELRNPLSAIRNTLFTVKELATNAGVKLDRPIARMERSIERCDRIISDLLEYTRNRELNLSSVRFDRWVAEVVAEQNIAPSVSVTTQLAAGETEVAMDPDRMRRVVINLVDNAVQAMVDLPAEHEKRVTVRTDVANGELTATVEDTGPGIAPENLSRIFEPLFSTKSFGTGLGLPTVKQVVNQHGGIIEVTSEVGKGTCVIVRLPLEAEMSQTVRAAA